jgi:hypothetical protein
MGPQERVELKGKEGKANGKIEETNPISTSLDSPLRGRKPWAYPGKGMKEQENCRAILNKQKRHFVSLTKSENRRVE